MSLAKLKEEHQMYCTGNHGNYRSIPWFHADYIAQLLPAYENREISGAELYQLAHIGSPLITLRSQWNFPEFSYSSHRVLAFM